MKVKVSIILPVYNTEKYLRRCLDALIRQTYPAFEILAVNDGSIDSSLEILNEYASREERLKVFSQENRGAATARNVALDHATGDYLMFCDSDDWYEENMVERMIETIEAEASDYVMCQTTCHLDEGCKREIYFLPESLYNPKKLSKYAVYNNCLLWNKIFRKSCLDHYHIRFPEGLDGEDNVFVWLFMMVAKKQSYLKEKLYHYVIRYGSTMDANLKGNPKDPYYFISDAHYTINHMEKIGLVQKNKTNLALITCAFIYLSSQYLPQEEIENKTQEMNAFLASHHLPKIVFIPPNKCYPIEKKTIFQYLIRFLSSSLKARIAKGEKAEKHRQNAIRYRMMISILCH